MLQPLFQGHGNLCPDFPCTGRMKNTQHLHSLFVTESPVPSQQWAHTFFNLPYIDLVLKRALLFLPNILHQF